MRLSLTPHYAPTTSSVPSPILGIFRPRRARRGPWKPLASGARMSLFCLRRGSLAVGSQILCQPMPEEEHSPCDAPRLPRAELLRLHALQCRRMTSKCEKVLRALFPVAPLQLTLEPNVLRR